MIEVEERNAEVFKNLGSFFGWPYQFNNMKIHLGMVLCEIFL